MTLTILLTLLGTSIDTILFFSRVQRSGSRSSMRRSISPFWLRTESHARSAQQRLPRCMRPEGLGANSPRTGVGCEVDILRILSEKIQNYKIILPQILGARNGFGTEK